MITPVDVVGIGNAIVDVLSLVDDEFLIKNNLTKGNMSLVDESTSDKFYRQLTPLEFSAGGSVANTLFTLSSFGAKSSYIGKIKDDAMGQIFHQDLKNANIKLGTIPSQNGPSTARCLLFITPDTKRTMQTYLGAAIDLTVHDVNISQIKDSKILLVEGYLFDPPHGREAALKAVKYAKEQGKKIALIISDHLCIKRHKDIFSNFIVDYVDYLFLGESEIIELSNEETVEKSIQKIKSICPIVVTSLEEHGSIISSGEEVIKFSPEKPLRLVDSVGIGSLHTGGFIFGLLNDYNIKQCAKIAALAVSEGLATIGSRPKKSLKHLLDFVKA